MTEPLATRYDDNLPPLSKPLVLNHVSNQRMRHDCCNLIAALTHLDSLHVEALTCSIGDRNPVIHVAKPADHHAKWLSWSRVKKQVGPGNHRTCEYATRVHGCEVRYTRDETPEPALAVQS